MIGSWISWWLVSALLGALAFPLCFRVFQRLPDRGLAFSRPLGLLMASYTLWLGASLGALKNSLGGALAGLFALALVSWLAGRGRWGQLRDWLRDHRRLLLAEEAVLLAGFAVWAFVRANNPEIQHTEKPMELAFINGILRSPSYPPADPWLSGHAISYYYFGYVMIALFIRLTGVSTGVAFNLANAMWFGMVAAASYALLVNLLALRHGRPRLGPALLGPLFVLITGNLEAFLDVLHGRYLFWKAAADGVMTSDFWRWLDIKQLVEPPVSNPSWMPSRFLWWWRASRVVRDVNLAGVDLEVIDEFPFFSFLLADNHPHLLAIPFALMAVGFALAVFLGGRRGELRLGQKPPALGTVRRVVRILAGLAGAVILSRLLIGLPAAIRGLGDAPSAGALVLQAVVSLALAAAGLGLLLNLTLVLTGYAPSALHLGELALASWLFGGLAFLNTWDSPIYLALLLGVLAWRARGEPLTRVLTRLALTALAVITGALLLYLPWYPSFASQAGGILPNVIFPTKLQHFVVMFGVAFVPIAAWMIGQARADWRAADTRTVLGFGLGVPLTLFLFSSALAGFLYVAFFTNPLMGEGLLIDMGIADASLRSGMRTLVQAVGARRLAHSGTALALGFTLAGVALLFRRGLRAARSSGRVQPASAAVRAHAGDPSADAFGHQEATQPWPFMALMIALGALLILAPEFFYLRDLFGTRMNTVFKFYFAAWLLWGVAGAYALAELWPERLSLRQAPRLLLGLPLLLGLLYPALATWTKTQGFQPTYGRTLDGAAYLGQLSPADYAAVQWMNDQLPAGVLVEAVGGSYTQYGRVAAHTGLPTVLGWDFHEVQWRGTAEPQGSRKGDVEQVYEAADWASIQPILNAYDVAYVYIGPLEYQTYQPINESKFEQHMTKIYQSDEVRIYARHPGVLR